MKTLSQYILEELETKIIKNLTVTYKTDKKEIYINCPDTFQEDDIHQYIDDLLLEQMPSNQDIAEKYFAANVKYINDAYFEYDSFQRLNYKKDHNIDIDYNDDFGKDVSEDTKIVTFKITNLRFIMLFSKFEIKLTNEDIDETLNIIFSAYESNDYNNHDISFTYASCKYLE